MWTQGPQSPLGKAMGFQDGNSCREREGQRFISKSVSSLRASSLVYLAFVLFGLKNQLWLLLIFLFFSIVFLFSISLIYVLILIIFACFKPVSEDGRSLNILIVYMTIFS